MADLRVRGGTAISFKARRLAQSLLTTKLQVRLGLKVLQASVRPLEPILSELSSKVPLSVIEVGTRFGESLKFIALKYRVSCYTAIDPFEAYTNYQQDRFNDFLLSSNADQIFSQTQALGHRLLGQKFRLIRHFSDDAAPLLEDESANFVFIDGNHTYPFVLDDLQNYWQKLSPGGFLAGHDFFMRSKALHGHYDEPMVFEAVQAFAEEKDLRVLTFGEHRGFPMCFAIQKLR